MKEREVKEVWLPNTNAFPKPKTLNQEIERLKKEIRDKYRKKWDVVNPEQHYWWDKLIDECFETQAQSDLALATKFKDKLKKFIDNYGVSSLTFEDIERTFTEIFGEEKKHG